MITKRSIYDKRSVTSILIRLAVVSFLLLLALFLPSHSANAANKSDWIAGNIISDANFTNKDSMSVSDIQAFLDSKIGSCDIWGTGQATEFGSSLTRAQYAASRGWAGPPYVCLNKYFEVPKQDPSSYLPANNFNSNISAPSGSQSAAWIIKDAANRYNISPKVLLVKLGTESAGPLTSDRWPLYSQYKYAMGARCPDSGPGGSANCDTLYAGFSIQMYEAAELLRWYLDSMNEPWWSYKRPNQTNSILWNVVERGCGSGDVYIENKATAALYTYTPYQPNNAALDNLYGTGDNCSAYGNRNFWRVYWDWFGNTRSGEGERNIKARYESLGGNASTLGYPVGTVVCGIKNNGCYQNYQGGAIVWSSASGAWESYGNIRARWLKIRYENGTLGYPTGPITCGLRDGGCYQNYQGGAILGNASAGYWENYGSTRARYAKLGFESSTLGYPVGSVVCGIKNNGCYQNYQGGAIVWSSASGAWESYGNIRARWLKIRYENGTLGYPTGPITCGLRDGGCYQNYQGGAILGNASAGYWENYGSTRARYAKLGFESSTLGYPVGSVVCGIKNNGCYQNYQGGAILGNASAGYWENYGLIRTKYAQLGFENSRLGYPVGAVSCSNSSTCYQEYSGGKIQQTPSDVIVTYK